MNRIIHLAIGALGGALALFLQSVHVGEIAGIHPHILLITWIVLGAVVPRRYGIEIIAVVAGAIILLSVVWFPLWWWQILWVVVLGVIWYAIQPAIGSLTTLHIAGVVFIATWLIYGVGYIASPNGMVWTVILGEAIYNTLVGSIAFVITTHRS